MTNAARDSDGTGSGPSSGLHSPSGRIQVLDSFRALAILSVMAFHILYLGDREQNTVVIDVGEPFSQILSYGWGG